MNTTKTCSKCGKVQMNYPFYIVSKPIEFEGVFCETCFESLNIAKVASVEEVSVKPRKPNE